MGSCDYYLQGRTKIFQRASMYTGDRTQNWIGGYKFTENSTTLNADWQWVSNEDWNWTNWSAGQPYDWPETINDNVYMYTEY